MPVPADVALAWATSATWPAIPAGFVVGGGEVNDGKAEAAVHIEIERDWRPNIPPRMFDYASAAAALAWVAVCSHSAAVVVSHEM